MDVKAPTNNEVVDGGVKGGVNNNSIAAPEPPREMKVLALGLPRTGTLSMAHALRRLGYQNVYHSLDSPEDEEHTRLNSRAADATFTTLPSYTGKPFTRAEWDLLYGSCEAVTETAALYGPQLVEAYPDAKVVLVVRDFERWFKSVDEIAITAMWSPLAVFFANFVHPALGLTTIVTARKTILGFFEARTPDEARSNARRIFDRHHRVLEETVPPEKLLVYHMGDGWEPLCEFLGKPVPDEPFPWFNEVEELKKKTGKILLAQLRAAVGLVPSYLASRVRQLFK